MKKQIAGYANELITNCDNMIAFRLYSSTINETIIIAVYIPPVDSPYYDDKASVCNITLLEDMLISLQEKFPVANYVICGDLNSRIGQWNLHTDEEFEDFDNTFVSTFSLSNHFSCGCTLPRERKSRDKTVNSFGKILKSFCKIHHCVILNGCTPSDINGNYTYISSQGESVVDYVMLIAPDPGFKVDLFVSMRVESDHMPLELLLGNIKCPTRHKKEVLTYSKLQWNPCNVELYRNNVDSPEFDLHLQHAFSLMNDSVELAISCLNDLLIQCAESMEKQIRVGGKHKVGAPWFDLECREKKKKTIAILKEFRRSHNEVTKEKYLYHRRQYKHTIKEKKLMHFSEIRTSLMDSLNDSRKFWQIIKSVTRRSIPQSDIDLEVWKSHFEKLFKDDDQWGVPEYILDDEIRYHELLDAPIKSLEIRKAFKRLRPGKAAGIDGVPGGCLKEAQEKLIPFLVKLFNMLYDSHYFPKIWAKSVIVPIHKKGDFHDPDNFRGISLLCATCKLFTSVLADRFRNWMESEEKLCPEQAGFRTGHSTVDHIFTLYAMVLKYVYGEGRGKLYVCFVDYRKAFDSVNHTQLWRVLSESGLSSKFLSMLKAIYADVQSCVRWQCALSDFFPCTVGVKQGAIESPGIFSLYINLVADFVRLKGRHGVQMLPGMMEIFSLLFADDIALISTTPAGLQNQINSLVQVSNTLRLKVNSDKTKIMVFRKGGHLAKGEQWFLEGTKLEVVNKYKYLGFVFTTKLSVNNALEDLCVKGKQKALHILKAMWSLRTLKTKVFFRMIDAQVVPTLLYSAEIWGLERHKKIETVHLFASKKFLGLSVRTPNHMVYGDLGRFPLYVYSSIRVIKYWLKLSKMDYDRLPKQAYLMLHNSNIKGKLNWVNLVKELLQRLGFGYVWLNGGVQNDRCFTNQLKQRLKDWSLQEWNSINRTSDRYIWYSTFKTSFGLENYLNCLDIKKFRDTLIRFRFGINDLAVNRRYESTEDVKCPFCTCRDDEIHLLFECHTYDFLRHKYLYGNDTVVNAKRSCCYWLNSTDYRRTRAIAMFVFYALRLRNVDDTNVNVDRSDNLCI